MRRAPAPSRRRDGLVYSPGAGRNIECVAAAGRSIYTGARAYGGGAAAGGGAEGEVLRFALPAIEPGPSGPIPLEGGVLALAAGGGWLAACCGSRVEWLRLQG